VADSEFNTLLSCCTGRVDMGNLYRDIVFPVDPTLPGNFLGTEGKCWLVSRVRQPDSFQGCPTVARKSDYSCNAGMACAILQPVRVAHETE
jgi:hypothetical protein